MIDVILRIVVVFVITINAIGFVIGAMNVWQAWRRIAQQEWPALETASKRFNNRNLHSPQDIVRLLRDEVEVRNTRVTDSQLAKVSARPVVIRVIELCALTGRMETDDLEMYQWIHLGRYLAGVYVFVGLLGTVLGIAVALTSLGGMQGQITGDVIARTAKLVENVGQLLSGLHAAFYSTLTGLFFTIVQSLFNHFYDAKCQRLGARLQAFAEVFIYPVIATTTNEGMLDDMRNSSLKLAGAAQELSSSASAMTISITTLGPTIDGLGTKVQTSVNALDSTISTMTPTFTNFSTNMEKSITHVITNIETHVKHLIAVSVLMGQSMTHTNTAMHTIQDTLTEAHNHITDQADALKPLITAFGETSSLLNAELKTANTVFEEIKNELKVFPDSTKTIAESVRKLSSEVTDVLATEEKRTREVTDKITDLTMHLDQLLTSLERTLLDITDVSSSTQLQESIKRVQESLAHLDLTKITDLAPRLHMVETLGRESRDLLHTMSQRVPDQDGMDSQEQRITTQITTLRTGLEHMERAIANTTGRVDVVVQQVARVQDQTAGFWVKFTTAITKILDRYHLFTGLRR